MFSAEFTCRCGYQKVWIKEGEVSTCPSCKRTWKGVYSIRKCSLTAKRYRPRLHNLTNKIKIALLKKR